MVGGLGGAAGADRTSHGSRCLQMGAARRAVRLEPQLQAACHLEKVLSDLLGSVLRASAVCDEALLGLRAPPGAGPPPWGACVGMACPPGGPSLVFLATISLRVGPVSDT